MPNPEFLDIRQLSIAFAGHERDIRVLDRVSLKLAAGETLGLVGESGCGKSTLCRGLLRGLRAPAYIAGGQVWWQGRDLFQLNEAELNQVRWREISLVVQSSLDALNPVMNIERQLSDCMNFGKDGNRARARELLDSVGLPQRVLKSYPFELSGGMRQRVVIAMALALRPKLLIMDEPTTALDVVTQAEILGRIRELQRAQGFSAILVTHDLPLAVDFCDTIAVMYAGRIVEKGPAKELWDAPQHPYTEGLLQAFPRTGELSGVYRGVPGDPVQPGKIPSGCTFHPRCTHANAMCHEDSPALMQRGEHAVACHHPRRVITSGADIRGGCDVIPLLSRNKGNSKQGLPASIP